MVVNCQMRSESRPTVARFATLSFFLFLLLANISFLGMERLTTGRVVIVLMLLWALAEGRKPFHFLASRVWLPFLPIAYVAVQYLLVGDSEQLSRFVNLAIYSYFGAALFASLAGDAKVVLWAILCAIALQSVIILFSFVNLDYRAWFDNVVATNSNYDASYLYRAPGFTSSGGASLSLTQSMGVLAAWLLLRQQQPEPVTGGMTYLVAFLGLLATASCVVVGRTGLLLSCLFLTLLLLESESRWRLLALLLTVVIGVWLYAGAFISSALGDSFSLDYFTTWAFTSFAGEDSSIAELSSMQIPALSLDTVVGTGLGGLVNGANPSGHDSGFVQTYYSMGLVFALVFYAAYLYVLLYCLRWLPPRWQILLTAVFFLLEIKEPFVFKYSEVFIVLSLSFSQQWGQTSNLKRIDPTPRLG